MVGAKIEPFDTPILMFQSQEKHKYRPNIFCLRDRTQTIKLRMSLNQDVSFEKTKYFVFSKGTPLSIVSNTF